MTYVFRHNQARLTCMAHNNIITTFVMVIRQSWAIKSKQLAILGYQNLVSVSPEIDVLKINSFKVIHNTNHKSRISELGARI